MNKMITASVILGGVALISLPAMASDDNTVFGISEHYAAQSITAQGFDVQGIEQWGDYVVATVRDGQGKLSFKYFTPTYFDLVK